jgi:prolyl 4-hydroxylase
VDQPAVGRAGPSRSTILTLCKPAFAGGIFTFSETIGPDRTKFARGPLLDPEDVPLSLAPVTTAKALLAEGDAASALAVLSAAAKLGDGDAQYELARWHVFGDPVGRDFAAARALFARAGEAGHLAAARTHAVFVALGAGGPADWTQAMDLLQQAATRDPLAADQLRLLDAMALDAEGFPIALPTVQIITASPHVALFPALLTPAECAHVATVAHPLLIPSVVVDPASGQAVPHPIRTSQGAVLGPIQMDLVVEALNRRIAAATGTRAEQGEPLTVLHYQPGQQYRLHHDGLPAEPNQRVWTVIVYLNDGYVGGATAFPALDVQVQGRAGDALIFANTHTDGRIDERSRHAGLPVARGEKWICTRWIRARDFDPWGMRPIGTHPVLRYETENQQCCEQQRTIGGI